MNQTKATSSETRRERKEEEMTIVRVLSNTIPFLTEIDHRSIATRNLHSKRRQKENIDHTDRKKRELTIARKKNPNKTRDHIQSHLKNFSCSQSRLDLRMTCCTSDFISIESILIGNIDEFD